MKPSISITKSVNYAKDLVYLNRLRTNGLPKKVLLFDNVQYLATHQHKFAHKSSNLIGKTQRWLPSPYLFGVNSKIFPGTKSQQMDNICTFYSDTFKYAYEKYKLDIKKLDPKYELLTKVSPVEFTGHPSWRDSAFTLSQTGEIVMRIGEQFEKATDKDDRNFTFLLTLPMVYAVDSSTGMQNVFHNGFFSFGRGIGTEPSLSLASPSESYLKILSFYKVNPYLSDIIHSGTHTLPSHGNNPVYMNITSSGNIILFANEICLDHNIGVMKGLFDQTGKEEHRGQFEKFLTHFVQASPYVFQEWHQNPLTHHDILSASVLAETDHIMSSIYSHTDRLDYESTQHKHMRGIYNLGDPIPLVGKEERLRSMGGNIKIRINPKFDAPKLSAVGQKICDRVVKDNQSLLDEAAKNKALVVTTANNSVIQSLDKPQSSSFSHRF